MRAVHRQAVRQARRFCLGDGLVALSGKAFQDLLIVA
jgi:hypothetical protein